MSAIDRLYIASTQREHLRAASLLLFRAGLPREIVTAIRDFAHVRCFECSELHAHKAPILLWLSSCNDGVVNVCLRESFDSPDINVTRDSVFADPADEKLAHVAKWHMLTTHSDVTEAFAQQLYGQQGYPGAVWTPSVASFTACIAMIGDDSIIFRSDTPCAECARRS